MSCKFLHNLFILRYQHKVKFAKTLIFKVQKWTKENTSEICICLKLSPRLFQLFIFDRNQWRWKELRVEQKAVLI